jgi:hypothetical protein
LGKEENKDRLSKKTKWVQERSEKTSATPSKKRKKSKKIAAVGAQVEVDLEGEDVFEVEAILDHRQQKTHGQRSNMMRTDYTHIIKHSDTKKQPPTHTHAHAHTYTHTHTHIHTLSLPLSHTHTHTHIKMHTHTHT